MKKKYLAMAAFALIMASCSNEEGLDNLKDTPITVTAGVDEMTTRAGYEGTTVLPETFYLSITQDATNTSSKYNYTDVLMTKDTNFGYTAPTGTTLLWMDSDRDAAINAYTIVGTTFTVETDQSAIDGSGVLASDLLGAKTATENSDITISGNNIAIAFRHLLCKLDVTYTWGTEIPADATKTIKSVMYQGFGTDVTLDRAACTVTSPTEPTVADIQALVGKKTVKDETTEEETTYDISEAIFAPHVDTLKIVITTAITTGTGETAVTAERVFSINVTAPTGGFVSGNRYTMNVTIGGTSVEDESVTATIANGWETGDANGEAEGTTGNMATN